MTPLPELEQDAREKRARLAKTLQRVRERLSPAAIADEAIGLVEPRLPQLRRMEAAARRHPVIAAGVLAGAGFLLKRAIRNEKPSDSASAANRRPLRKP